jgi:hypothetical protein
MRAQVSCHPPGQEPGIQPPATPQTASSRQTPRYPPPACRRPACTRPGRTGTPSPPHPHRPAAVPTSATGDRHTPRPLHARTTTLGLLNTTPAEHLIAAARAAAGYPASPHPAQGPTACQPAQITRFGRCEISQVTAARCARSAVRDRRSCHGRLRARDPVPWLPRLRLAAGVWPGGVGLWAARSAYRAAPAR